ncbi:PucR family transcriptional regulator [Gordonia insulae]|uniref:Transcriptional activator PmfR n=1 Tax=Gordonia insulae TaxID=2420509 RepID=A0A3G8JU04_9ACTN|nr:PucR family transcriptional regulator [Gordonia insulae]AZG48012.1 Transcriptional activator PmfR [Gordonia insulae]
MTTVRWLLAQRRLQLALRGGATGLDRRMDCAVSSELVNAGEWLSGGEVLLTTGLRLDARADADADVRIGFLRHLDEVGVAAVGLGVGFGFDEVPADMVAAADELGLPLFEVPLPIPFSAITRAVLEQIAAQRSSRLVAATKAQPRMTRAAASGGSAALVRELAEAVDQNVVLLDTGLAVVATAPRTIPAADLNRIRDLVVRDPASAGAVWMTGDATMTVARVGSGGRTFGHLGVVGPTALDDVARMLVGHAISLLAIEHAKPRQVARDVVDLHDDALALVIDGAGAAGPGLHRILGRAGDRSGRVRAVVFSFADAEAATQGRRRLVDELEHRWRPVFAHRDGSDLIALLRGDDHVDFVTGLLTMLNTTGPVSGGIGPAMQLREVGESVRQARLACRSSAIGQIVDLHGSRSLLAMDPVRRALTDAFGQRLAPVLDHDEEHGTDLRASLLAFLEANGNWGVAASAQGIHRHTLRHRIERIEDMLQVDLSDARTRAELLLMLLGASA